MSDLSYKIEIGGVEKIITSVSEANKVIKQLTSQIILAKEAGQDYTQTLIQLNKALDIRQGVANISRGIAQANINLEGSQRASANAASALLNLNYVVRDSPYFFNNFALGVMAVGNNINPLIDSFGRLRQEAGERTVTTFSLLKQALVGSAGISIAFSLVVTAIQSYVFWMSKAESQSKATKEEISETVKALQALIDIRTPAKSRVFDLSPDQLKQLIAGLDEQIKALETTKTAIQKAPQTIGSENTKVKLDLTEISNKVKEQKKDQSEIVDELKKQKTGLEAQLKVMGILRGLGLEDVGRQKEKNKELKEQEGAYSRIASLIDRIAGRARANTLAGEGFGWRSEGYGTFGGAIMNPLANDIQARRKENQGASSGSKAVKDMQMDLEMGKIAAQQLGDALAQAFDKGKVRLDEFINSMVVAISKMLLLRAITSFLTGGIGGGATATSATASIPSLGKMTGNAPSGNALGKVTFVFENTIEGQKIIYKGIKEMQAVQR